MSRSRFRRFAVIAAAAALLVFLVAVARAAQRQSPVAGLAAFHSSALDATLHLAVSLPPEYADGRRYPVVYFLHGLPAGARAYRDVSVVTAGLATLEQRAIVIAPQGATDADSDPEYLDWGRGRNWETAIARDLVAYVDGHFRTIANRHGRAIVGLSAGGYGAMLIGLHHLDEFAAIESWSGYHTPTDPSGKRTLDLGSRAANVHANAHSYVASLRHAFAVRPTLLGFYVGKDDARFLADNALLDRELTGAHVPHLFRIYPGGHERTLWSAHAAEWLGLALDRLAAPA